jgi:hypothetical protein
MSDGREATLGEAQEFLRNSKERAIEAGEFEAAERLRRMEFAIRDGTGRMKAVERENLQLRQTPPNVAAESEAERLRRELDWIAKADGQPPDLVLRACQDRARVALDTPEDKP